MKSTAILLASVLVGCSGVNAAMPQTAPQFRTPRPDPTAPASSAPASNVSAANCQPFASSFDGFVACRRANGTLSSFGDEQIAWRVRYFVRYQAMPCNEAPTVQEAYVFHAVMDDLEGDKDITDSQRASIRIAMFDGKAHCK